MVWKKFFGSKDESRIQLQCQTVAAQCGYPIEAVTLVLHVLTQGNEQCSSSHEMSAQEICDGLLKAAATSYGDRALGSLEGWDLGTSEDVGRVAMALAEAGLVRIASGESHSDFQDLYSEEDLPGKLVDAQSDAGTNADAVGKSGAAMTLIPRLVEHHFRPHSVQSLTVTQRNWPYRVRVDLQRALDQILAAMSVAHFSSARKEYSHEGLSLHELMVYSRHDNAVVVPTIYEEIDIGEDSPARCLKNALWLVHAGPAKKTPMAILMSPNTVYGQVNGVKFEVAAPVGADSVLVIDDFFRSLERAIHESRSYRGKVLSLEQHDHYRGQATGIKVHKLRTIARDQVVLPRKTLELLDRNVIDFVNKRPQLAELSMQTKKGLLFYGPPGTGKTHTIHYLAGSLSDHTTLLVTAEQVGLLPEVITLSRLLQPSMVIIEDADLIARNRQTMQGPCEELALNRLLNEMDGLREDADVIFILTTNRPEMIEPALAARPGRIDQAIEFPLPDADGRTKLVRLYGHSAVLDEATIETIVQKTEGVSAAFIKELMRRAAQFHLERTDGSAIELEDIDSALEEMLFTGGSLNRKLLGASNEESRTSLVQPNQLQSRAD